MKIEITMGNPRFYAGSGSIPELFRCRQDFKPIDQPCNMGVDPRILHGTTYYRNSFMTEEITKMQPCRKTKFHSVQIKNLITMGKLPRETVCMAIGRDYDVIIVPVQKTGICLLMIESVLESHSYISSVIPVFIGTQDIESFLLRPEFSP
jgi:hypothetical protein